MFTYDEINDKIALIEKINSLVSDIHLKSKDIALVYDYDLNRFTIEKLIIIESYLEQIALNLDNLNITISILDNLISYTNSIFIYDIL